MTRLVWKAFIFVFLVSFAVFNWQEVSPYFNLNLLSGQIGKIFEREEVEAEAQELKIPKEGMIEIAEIGVSAPIVFSQSVEEIDKDLKKGVALFPQSAIPGTKGLSIILGHSGPPGWPDIDYDTVFSRVNELKTGDEIKIVLNKKIYSFKVNKKVIFDKGEDFPYSLDYSKPNILLLSCWPPGKNYKRIGVQAELF